MRMIKKGATDQSVVIRIIDSADGTPETGVEHNSTGIDLWYRREGATKTSITEAALAALDSAHADGGIEHIDDGYYRLDLPDAAFATGVNGVMIGGAVDGMVVIGVYVHLVDFDPQDAVRLGLTALPNAAADAAGGLPISDAGGLDMDAQRSDVAAILVDTAVIGAAGAGLTEAGGTGDHLTAVPWNAAWDAEVQSEVTDGLNAYDPPTRAEATSDVNSVLAVLGALNDAAADGAVTTTDTIVAYLKQLINTLEGTPGIPAWPSSAAPGNAVSIAEAIRQIYDEVAGLNGGALIAAADVWSVATRTLTALDEDSTTLDLDATIRSALGMASANLDTQLDALPTAAENAAALMDLSNGIETSITPRQALRLILAASAGKLSGAATTTITIRNVGDSKDRITATVDADGNRSAVTTDAT